MIDQATVEQVRQRLWTLLPVHVRTRDAATGGLLDAVLAAVAGELAVVEADIQRLYDAWFIETCPEWVVPYLADLVGLVGLPEVMPPSGTRIGPVSRRAVVANTASYRRRKGTVGVVEQVVADVTGQVARAVEHHTRLVTTVHINHVRLDRPALTSLRDAAGLELEAVGIAGGALGRCCHTGEVRRIASGRGRYGVANLGVFTFPLQVAAVKTAQARSIGDGTVVATHPLGWQEPLFAEPAPEPGMEHLAQEPNLPVPLRPRRLLALLNQARTNGSGAELPVRVTVAGSPLSPDRVRVCGLEELAQPTDGWQVFVDPIRGRVTCYHDGVPTAPDEVVLDIRYGALADLGATAADRTTAHEEALAADAFTGDQDHPDRRAVAQVHVGSAPGPNTVMSLAQGLARVEAGWADPEAQLVGSTQYLSVGRNRGYAGDLRVEVPPRSRLVLVAAHWSGALRPDGEISDPVPGRYAVDGLRPALLGTLTVRGETDAALLLDGLMLDGDLVIDPGELASLTINQCTIAGAIRVSRGAGGDHRGLRVTVLRSLVGSIELAETVPQVTVRDSIVDPALAAGSGAFDASGAPSAPGGASDAVVGRGAHLVLDGVTVRGQVRVRTLQVSSSVCDGVVTVAHRQVGCARYSYLGPGSRVPRRFRCVPATDASSAPGPSYLSDRPGDPWYLALSENTAVAIRRGGENGSEMGVHHHLARGVHLDAAARLVAPYLPVGVELGIIGSGHAG